MPRGSDPTPPRTETPAGLRDMAARARRLASSVLDQRTISELTTFAAELEARTAALETAPQTVSHQEAAAAQQSDPDLGQLKLIQKRWRALECVPAAANRARSRIGSHRRSNVSGTGMSGNVHSVPRRAWRPIIRVDYTVRQPDRAILAVLHDRVAPR